MSAELYRDFDNSEFDILDSAPDGSCDDDMESEPAMECAGCPYLIYESDAVKTGRGYMHERCALRLYDEGSI